MEKQDMALGHVCPWSVRSYGPDGLVDLEVEVETGSPYTALQLERQCAHLGEGGQRCGWQPSHCTGLQETACAVLLQYLNWQPAFTDKDIHITVLGWVSSESPKA
jgi:hypothetical protein